MLNIRKILVPIDFPDVSLRVIHESATLARHFNAQIVILHVVTPLSRAAGIPDPGREPADWDLVAVIHSEAQKVQDQSLRAECTGARYGHRPADTLPAPALGLVFRS